MIKVLNIYKLNNLKLEDCIYIGRSNNKFNLSKSPLSNPFTISTTNTREQVVIKYKDWLDTALTYDNEVSKEFNRLVELAKVQEVYLLCYCNPKACHGDYIKQLIENKLKVGMYESI